MAGKTKRRWVAKVKTESTYPPEGLFNKSAATIASRFIVRADSLCAAGVAR